MFTNFTTELLLGIQIFYLDRECHRINKYKKGKVHNLLDYFFQNEKSKS